MSIPRYYTIGAIVPDLRSLKALDERLWSLKPEIDSPVVFVRRKDERLVRVALPDANVRRAESGLSRLQWFEFASVYLAVSATTLLMGAVHLPTGIVVQAVMTVAAVVGILLYYRQPQLEKKLLRMAVPDSLAGDWEESFPHGVALVLVSVPGELFDEAQEAFLEDEGLKSPLAVDRRLVT
ncbi:MAG: hypothetical protein H0V53_08320 [Rubrobacter sp.]|nr:hypothetical protein [Rubrobacter sp.]